MEEIVKAIAILTIALSILIFFGPIIVIISIIGSVSRGDQKIIDLTNMKPIFRVLIAIVGLVAWLAVYIPLVSLALRAVTPPTIATLPSPTPPSSVTLSTTNTPTDTPMPTPTNTPTTIPTDTPTLTPALTNTPTPTLAVSPEQAVKDYYQLINQRQYEMAWKRLTSGFQQRPSTGDYNAYVTWWDSVATVNMGEVTLITQSDNMATVFAQLWYSMKDGRKVNDEAPRIQLVRDITSGIWLIDGKGP